jgi:hypothetical protein
MDDLEACSAARSAIEQLVNKLKLLPREAANRLGSEVAWLLGPVRESLHAPHGPKVAREALHALRGLQNREGFLDDDPAGLEALHLALEEAAAIDAALAARLCHGNRPGFQFVDLGQRFLSSRKVGIFSAPSRDEALLRGDLRVAGNFSAVDAGSVGTLRRINIWSGVGKAESAVVVGLWAPESKAFSDSFIHPYGRRGLGRHMPNAQDQLASNWMTACVGQLMLRRLISAHGPLSPEGLMDAFARSVDETLEMAEVGLPAMRAPVLQEDVQLIEESALQAGEKQMRYRV